MKQFCNFLLATLLVFSQNAFSSIYDDLAAKDFVLPLKGVWVDASTIAIKSDDFNRYQYKMYSNKTGRLTFNDSLDKSAPQDVGIELQFIGDFNGENSTFYKKFDYLRRDGYSKYLLPLDDETVKAMVKDQVYISKIDKFSGAVKELFAVSQIGVLDDLFAYHRNDLGVSFRNATPTIKLWAPTATDVRLRLFKNADLNSEYSFSPLTMTEENGVWSIEGDVSWKYAYYQFDITSFKRTHPGFTTETVSDLYAVSTGANGQLAQIIDIENDFKPAGFDEHEVKNIYPYNDFSDIALYELHVRDFSYFDFTQPEEFRGKFMAFTNEKSNGVKHLKRLAEAGITHIHLLPTFDMSSVEEDPRLRRDIEINDYHYLKNLPKDSYDQQNFARNIQKVDGQNWGYDPAHYQALEGSYGTIHDSPKTILEYRKMVQSLHSMGLRVVNDVVFNHYGGLDHLDAYVPDYYYNYNCGEITYHSCCPDLATEVTMVEHLLVNSAVNMINWYRLDGLRFDLMGFLTKDLITKIHNRVPKDVYLYGEGWQFGPLVEKLPFEAATQNGVRDLPFTVGTFNDHYRDALKGRGQNTHDLFIDDSFVTDKIHGREAVLTGLMGSLVGVKEGYVNDPQGSINYVTAHDKTTLFDQMMAKIGRHTSVAHAVKFQQMITSVLTLSQGVPFYHSGVEILRSKSGDENSYDSGDWFNRLDFSYRDNGFASGLPPVWNRENELAIPYWKDMFARFERPSNDLILDTLSHFETMLKIRKSSKLFSLNSREQILDKLSFPADIKNTRGDFDGRLVVVKIDNEQGTPVESPYKQVFIAINVSWDEPISFTDEAITEEGFRLHPELMKTTGRFDRAAAKNSVLDLENNTVTIAPQSVLVFVVDEE